jgi:carboxypeptidase C (cathepsin A)
MRKYSSFLICYFIAMVAMAQKTSSSNTIADLIPAGVEVTITHNSVTVDGKKIDYTASTGYLNLKNDTGKLIAKVFCT